MSDLNPILITGADRSGSTIVAKIMDMCGVWSGMCNSMFENVVLHSLHYEVLDYMDDLFPETSSLPNVHNWRELVLNEIKSQGWKEGTPWMVKGSYLARYWPFWVKAFPDAKWLIIRRRTGDIIQSCIKTGYMRTFKQEENLHALGLREEKDGWLWWVRQYENKFLEIIKQGASHKVVWPDRMVPDPVFNPLLQFKQMYDTIKWLGLEWNDSIPEKISPLMRKGGK